MLVLALFGVAYTNFARQAMTGYWMGLAPVFGLICVILRRQGSKGSQAHLRLIVTQALHWTAVVFAMYLVFVADVKQMMSKIASSLMVLIVLALGTFTPASTSPPGVFAFHRWASAFPSSLGSRRVPCLSFC